jgi:hypothetical protein
MIVLPDEERFAVAGSRGKLFEEELQRIDTDNQDGCIHPV